MAMPEVNNAETARFPAKVAEVSDDYTVVINRGSVDGVSKRQRFLIYFVGHEVKDPETGESLGPLEVVRGTGIVTHVQERIATIKSDMIESKTKVLRKIPRYPFLLSAFSDSSEEEIEKTPKPFDNPNQGDFAKPI
jgi:hypothetical protein